MLYCFFFFFFWGGEVSFFFITVSNLLLYPFVCPQRETVDVWCLPLSGISGLSFDSTLLSPPCSSAESRFSFCLIFFLLPAGPFSWLFSRKFVSCFSLRDRLLKLFLLLFDSCLAAEWCKLVNDMYSMLPYSTGYMLLCMYIIWIFFIASVLFIKCTFFFKIWYW